MIFDGRDGLRWTDLFDPFLRDRVFDLLRGGHADLAPLLRLIDAYLERPQLSRAEVEAAEELRDTAENVAAWLEGGVLDHVRVEALRSAWLELIATATAHHVYHGLPKKHAAASRGGRASGRNKLPPPQDLRRELDALVEKHGELRARSIIHQKYSDRASRQAINRALRRN